jgi:hypothetical protein
VTPRPKERLTELPNGLVVVRYEMTPEQKKQRRQDNKTAKKSRQLHRKRKKHGR